MLINVRVTTPFLSKSLLSHPSIHWEMLTRGLWSILAITLIREDFFSVFNQIWCVSWRRKKGDLLHKDKEQYFPPSGDSPTSPDKPRIPNGTPEIESTLAAGGTPHTSSILRSEQNGNLWGGVIGAVVLLVLAGAVFGLIRRKSNARRKRDVTAGNDRRDKQQRRPLIKPAKLGEFNTMPPPISHLLSLLLGMGALG